MATEPSVPAMEPVLANIRESFGRVVYSHKAHEKAREISSRHARTVKWTTVVLITLTSSSLLITLITDKRAYLYVSSALSAIALAFSIFRLNFGPERTAERHRETARRLWHVREQYLNLMADIFAGALTPAQAISRRDGLTESLKAVYDQAPDTGGGAYRRAQKALRYKEEMTFSDAELNAFLPAPMHIPPK